MVLNIDSIFALKIDEHIRKAAVKYFNFRLQIDTSCF